MKSHNRCSAARVSGVIAVIVGLVMVLDRSSEDHLVKAKPKAKATAKA